VHLITFLSQLSTQHWCYPVEFCLGIGLGSASVCYNRTTQQTFLGQFRDLNPYVWEHAISDLPCNHQTPRLLKGRGTQLRCQLREPEEKVKHLKYYKTIMYIVVFSCFYNAQLLDVCVQGFSCLLLELFCNVFHTPTFGLREVDVQIYPEHSTRHYKNGRPIRYSVFLGERIIQYYVTALGVTDSNCLL